MRSGRGRGALAWWLACASLGALAYRELLWAQPERALPEELEQWFFVPSASVTPAVMLLALWLLYRRLPRLRAAPPAPGSWVVGGALLAAGVGLYLWATYTGAADLLVPSLMCNALGCAWLWRGRAAVEAVRVPVAFLVFAMPLPAPLLNELIFLLQVGTTDLAAGILYLLEIPHVVSGERIVRPGNTFSVIESCSGLRSMETLTIVAILMVDLFRRRGLHAWLVVLAAPPVAFLLNGVRAVTLIVNPHSEIAAIHNLQGIAILLGGLLLLFALDALLEWGPFGLRSAYEPPPDPHPAPAGAGGARASTLALGVALAVSLVLPPWHPSDPPPLAAAERTAAQVGIFQAARLDTDRLFLGSTGFSESFTYRVNERGRDPVVLFMGVGRRSNRSRSALSPKTAYPGSGWIVEERFPVALEPGGPTIEASVLRSGSSRVLVHHWVEGAAPWPAEVLRSVLALDRSPLRRAGEILVVRTGTPIYGSVPTGKERAEQRLVSFYRTLRPLLDVLKDELEKSFSRFS